MFLAYGYAGRILYVDLTKGKFNISPTKEYNRDFLGGLAINAKILWDQTPSGIDPFSPKNLIAIGAGPLAGTMTPGSGRLNISSKSPLTNGYACSNIGGSFAAIMKYAGYDHIIITGHAEKPCYLWIDDEHVELKDANEIWGKDLVEAQDLIQKELEDPKVSILCIGQAGENKVRFASIMSSKENSAATKGIGAVMGSKNLKAVVVRGTRGIKYRKPKEFYDLAIQAHKNLAKELPGENYHKLMAMVYGFEKPEWEAFGNWEDTSLPPEFQDIYRMRDEFGENYWVKDLACFSCPSKCYSVFSVPGIGTAPAMCECWHHWGRAVKVPSLEENFKFVLKTQRYGVDYLSLSNVIAFAMDLFERGIITTKDTDGIKLEFGNAEIALEMADRIVNREGFGDILAEGVKRASDKIGRDSEKFAFHVKGREMSGMDPRTSGDIALGIVTQYKVNTGQNYFAMSDYFEKLGKKVDLEKLAMERLGTTEVCGPGYEAAPIAFRYFEDLGMMCDLVSVCRMVSLWTLSSPTFDAITPEKMASFISAAAFDLDVKSLWKYTEKCRNLIRAYNIREGLKMKDETLPKRMFTNPILKGIHKGKKVDKKKFDEMLKKYYELRGWDPNTGIPTREKLEELDLKDVANYLENT
jgi:aldehyde:ferredoxin oxidoreductase